MNTYRVNFLYLDMNSFFASVEQQEEPALRGKPVGIVTIAKGNAACIAASYEAKKLGVGMGVRMREASKLCPGIAFRPARHDIYVRYHHKIIDAVERVYPVAGVHSVDEVSCRLIGWESQLDHAQALAEDIRASIYRHAGVALRCSIGLGSSLLLAKMASDLQKPEGLQWLVPEVLPEKIAHLKLDDIPGIGGNMARRLHAAGIDSVAGLYAMPAKHARKVWKSVNGERLIFALRGNDVPAAVTASHSLGHSQILAPVNTNPANAKLVARRLLIKAATRLRRADQLASSLSVSVKCANKGWAGLNWRMPPTQDSFTLLSLFSRMWENLAPDAPLVVSVMLGGLADVHQVTHDFFSVRDGPGDQTKREKLCALIDGLNQHHGQNTIVYGEKPVAIAPYTGAKIAFGRIPTIEEFRD